MDLELHGKVAFVAAASRGLGKGIALALAGEGARCIICSRNEESIQRAAEEIRRQTGSEVLALTADLQKSTEIAAAVSSGAERFGGIDILITNAGGPPPGGFDAHEDPAWEEAFHLTLMSVVRLIREALPHMKKRGWGRIINLTSQSVKQPIPSLILSNALRPGVIGLAKTLAAELAPHRILINNIATGRIDTERVREIDEAKAQREGRTVEEVKKETMASIPLGRYGVVNEVAHMVTFLASEKASFITGATIPVDGGACSGLL
jgi:3-oxoacyl-[acyl-carrier protein] reductase